jgi:hypothetical protein
MLLYKHIHLYTLIYTLLPVATFGITFMYGHTRVYTYFKETIVNE